MMDDDDKKLKPKTPLEQHQMWTKEMGAAEKRLRKYKKQGISVVARFLDERDGAQDAYSTGRSGSTLNLFHKNVTTTCSMLYGNTPEIDVSREHADPDDDIARVAALMFQRMLQAEYESSGEDLSTVLKATLEDRLLPGMGIARVRYEMTTKSEQMLNPMTMQMEEVEVMDSEDAVIDYIHWQDVCWGWGRTWKEIPWWAFRSWMTKDEIIERFGEKIAKNIEYKNQSADGSSKSGNQGDSESKDNIQKAEIWEIWQKKDKKVYWFSSGAELILDVKDDPLGLRGFWPIPRPMIANPTTSLFTPKADFLFAQDLYNEIDKLQNRISTITEAIKVVGVYDKGAGDSVGRMLKEGSENALIPVDNWARFSEVGGLQGSMQWFPTESIVAVLQTLQAVQQVKTEQLYEITGMSDIMRGGNTDQYTSGGTQALKAKMGSIGIQALQEEFARFAGDLEALKAEVISKHFQKETIVLQSNAGFLPEADKEDVSAAIELMQSPDCKWRVNIRPESVAMIDYAAMQRERSEFLMSMSQFIQSASGAVEAMPDSLPMMMELMKYSLAGQKGAEYLEGTLDAAIDKAKKAGPEEESQEPSPEQMKLQIEQLKLEGAQAKQQGEMQKIQAKSQADMQTQQAKIAGEIQKMQMDAQLDMSVADKASQNRLMEIARELETSLAEIQANMAANLQVEKAQAEFNLIEEDTDHANSMQQIRASSRTRETS